MEYLIELSKFIKYVDEVLVIDMGVFGVFRVFG